MQSVSVATTTEISKLMHIENDWDFEFIYMYEFRIVNFEHTLQILNIPSPKVC